MSATDRTDDKPDKGKTLPESLPGAQHPLAMPSTDSLKSSAVEIVQGPDWQTQEKPIEKLPAGDHTIQFKDGRQFLVHIPPTESKNRCQLCSSSRALANRNGTSKISLLKAA